MKELLDCFIQIAPTPIGRDTEERRIEPTEEKFTGFVFKIHANMDPNHRDRIAFVRVVSGRFERNKNYFHVRQRRELKFSNPTAFMAQKKSVLDEAYPGDIVGLYDAGNFKIGDTLTEGEILNYRGIPSFSPEQFRYVENSDPMKSKQLAKRFGTVDGRRCSSAVYGKMTGRKSLEPLANCSLKSFNTVCCTNTMQVAATNRFHSTRRLGLQAKTKRNSMISRCVSR